jgi:hypothetical protein
MGIFIAESARSRQHNVVQRSAGFAGGFHAGQTRIGFETPAPHEFPTSSACPLRRGKLACGRHDEHRHFLALMADSGAPLKLRIGAMLAMAALIVGLIFLLRELRQRIVGPGRDAQPPAQSVQR